MDWSNWLLGYYVSALATLTLIRAGFAFRDFWQSYDEQRNIDRNEPPVDSGLGQEARTLTRRDIWLLFVADILAWLGLSFLPLVLFVGGSDFVDDDPSWGLFGIVAGAGVLVGVAIAVLAITKLDAFKRTHPWTFVGSITTAIGAVILMLNAKVLFG